MLIKHTVAKGETYEDILKKYKIKDGKSLWALKNNKSICSKRKNPKNLQPGDIIYVPEKNSKFYTFKDGSKVQVYTEEEWKEFTTGFIAKVKAKVLKPVRQELKYQDQMFKHFNDLNKDFKLAAFIYEWTTWSDLPEKEKKAAKKAIDAYESALNSNNFKKLPSLQKNMAKALGDYTDEMNSYEATMTGSKSDSIIQYNQIIADRSFQFVTIFAVTLAAPAGASLAVMVRTGFVIGGSSGFTKSVLNEVGQSLAGNDRSAATISWNIVRSTFDGALMGGLNAGLGWAICGKVAVPLAKSFLARPMMAKVLSRFISSQHSWTDRMLGGAISRALEKNGSAYATDLAEVTAMKLLIRFDVSEYTKNIRQDLFNDQPALKNSVKLALKKSKGNESVEQLAQLIFPHIDSDKIYDKIMKDFLKKNSSSIKKEMETSINKA
ncbi:LysM peptidoglycan-binding domain-containing protein [Pseudopelagicola sp. nBUS_19]|uniref:LysM peptidoglycan-binding domain-containing protein n=1 Tax=Pseudopelagicola sp. nBUS_19 TaxID=3395316 RepID=UPI003EBB042F